MAFQDVQEGTIPSNLESEAQLPSFKKSKVPKYMQQDGTSIGNADAPKAMQGIEMIRTGMISTKRILGGVSANPSLSKSTKGRAEILTSARGQELKANEGKHEDLGGQMSQNSYKGAGQGRPDTVEPSNQFKAAEEEGDCKVDPPDKRSEDLA